MSLETPDRPSNPLFLLSISSLCAAVSPSVRSRKASTPASTSPQRVPMISPSAGVNPMVVSTERPWSTAQSDGPFALQLEAVGVVAPAQRRGRLERIGHDRFHPVGDGPRDVLDRVRLGHDDGLEQGHGDQQHLAARLGDEIRDRHVAGH